MSVFTITPSLLFPFLQEYFVTTKTNTLHVLITFLLFQNGTIFDFLSTTQSLNLNSSHSRIFFSINTHHTIDFAKNKKHPQVK